MRRITKAPNVPVANRAAWRQAVKISEEFESEEE